MSLLALLGTPQLKPVPGGIHYSLHLELCLLPTPSYLTGRDYRNLNVQSIYLGSTLYSSDHTLVFSHQSLSTLSAKFLLNPNSDYLKKNSASLIFTLLHSQATIASLPPVLMVPCSQRPFRLLFIVVVFIYPTKWKYVFGSGVCQKFSVHKHLVTLNSSIDLQAKRNIYQYHWV